jgi:phosphoribosylglycinamide formyltransferase-1
LLCFSKILFKDEYQRDVSVLNLAILISGRGSNMESILSAVLANKITNVKPCVVISNNPDASGLKVASEKFEIPVEVAKGNGAQGWPYDQRIFALLHQYGVTAEAGLVCLAGFMRVISPEFIRHYKMRIMNIHPALLPSFPGLHAQRQALKYGVKISGCTVHFVDEGIDSGPIILQRVVTVRDSDTEESLSSRILEQEHILYPESVKLFAEGKITVVGRRVFIHERT